MLRVLTRNQSLMGLRGTLFLNQAVQTRTASQFLGLGLHWDEDFTRGLAPCLVLQASDALVCSNRHIVAVCVSTFRVVTAVSP